MITLCKTKSTDKKIGEKYTVLLTTVALNDEYIAGLKFIESGMGDSYISSKVFIYTTSISLCKFCESPIMLFQVT